VTEAGWFPDPMSPFMVRWWDGQAWTNEVRPGGGGPDPAADVVDEAKGRSKVKLWWALWIALGVLGLASIAGSFLSAGLGLMLAALASATAFAASWAGRAVIDEVDRAHAEAVGRPRGPVAGAGGRYR
jgi:Protein of unknown function (DUF2510)